MIKRKDVERLVTDMLATIGNNWSMTVDRRETSAMLRALLDRAEQAEAERNEALRHATETENAFGDHIEETDRIRAALYKERDAARAIIREAVAWLDTTEQHAEPNWYVKAHTALTWEARDE